MPEKIPAAPFIPDSEIAAQAAAGQALFNTQRNGPPRQFTPQPQPGGWQDAILHALAGLNAGTQAAAGVSKFGDPTVGALAGISAGLGAPGMVQDFKMKQLESTPVENVSPDLVAQHPELAGIPLGVINKIQPFILSQDRIKNARLMFEGNAALRLELQKASPIIRQMFEAQMGLPTGTLSGLKEAEVSQLADKNGGKLSPELEKLLLNSKDGIESIARAKARLEGVSGDIALKKAAVGGVVGRLIRIGDEDAQVINAGLKNAQDVLTRLRTGAALNNQEDAYYSQIVNDALRSGKVNREQIDNLENFLRMAIADIEAGKRGPGKKWQAFILKANGGQSTAAPAPAAPAPAAPAGGIIRKPLSGGRIGTWDSTGKWLGYAS